MLNLNPETVQLLAALVILPPLAYLAHWLRRYRANRPPVVTDRGFICVDQYREERREQLRRLQARANVVSFRTPAAKGFHRWPKDAA